MTPEKIATNKASASAGAQVRVQRVAEAITEQVDRQDGEQDDPTGITHSHHATRKYLRPSASIRPHSAVGGCAPNPRNDSDAVASIAVASTSSFTTVRRSKR